MYLQLCLTSTSLLLHNKHCIIMNSFEIFVAIERYIGLAVCIRCSNATTRKASFVMVDWQGAGIDCKFQVSQIHTFFQLRNPAAAVDTDVAFLFPCPKCKAITDIIDEKSTDIVSGLVVICAEPLPVADCACIDIKFIIGRVITANTPPELQRLVPLTHRWVVLTQG